MDISQEFDVDKLKTLGFDQYTLWANHQPMAEQAIANIKVINQRISELEGDKDVDPFGQDEPAEDAK